MKRDFVKIGFFTDTYYQINGVTVTIKALEKSLREMGHEVFIYAPKGDAGQVEENPNVFTSQGVRFIISPEYKWAVFPVFTIPRSNLGLDIIHVHSPVSMGLAGMINARRLAIPCIGSIHTLLPEFWKPFIDKLLPYITPSLIKNVTKQFVKLIDRFSLLNTTVDLSSFFMEELSWRYFAAFFKRCNVALTPSKYAQEICQKHGLDTRVLPNGINFSKFQISKDLKSFNERWGLNSKDTVAIYVGRLSEEKNIDLILKSAEDVLKTEDLKYMIVGDGPFRSKLESLVRNSRISENVIFTGYLEQEELNQCYSRADFFINASPLETQGLSVIEAMYFGLPILSINSGAVTELFETASIGLLFENSKDDLTRVVKQILNDRSLLKDFQKNSTKEAKKYDIKEFSKQLISIYDEFLQKK